MNELPNCPYVDKESYMSGGCASEGPSILCYKKQSKVQTKYCPCKEWLIEKNELDDDWVPDWMKSRYLDTFKNTERK